MASWRIVCVKQGSVNHPIPHTHVVGVGTGDRPDWADMRWTLAQILIAMDEGDTFYTQSATSGQVTQVERYVCPHCHQIHIRSASDSVPDNNLDNLRSCAYDS